MKQYTSNIKKVSVPWDFMERGGQESLEMVQDGAFRRLRVG